MTTPNGVLIVATISHNALIINIGAGQVGDSEQRVKGNLKILDNNASSVPIASNSALIKAAVGNLAGYVGVSWLTINNLILNISSKLGY